MCLYGFMTTSQAGARRRTDPFLTSRAHRLRAAALGGIGVVILLLGAALISAHAVQAWRGTAAEATVRIEDVVPALALALLAGCLAWSAVLLGACVVSLLDAQLLAVRLGGVPVGRGTASTDDTTGRRPLAASPLGMRITVMLLGLTALGSAGGTTSASAAAALVVTSHSSAGPEVPGAPVPTFSTPDPRIGRAAESQTSPLPPNTVTAPAAGTIPAADHPGAERGCAVPQPGWQARPPRLQAGHAQDQARLLGFCARPDGDAVVVRRGDTLWDLVARHLGPDADSEEIARAWPSWYAHNRAVIGDDPDLLLPGTILTRPAQETAR